MSALTLKAIAFQPLTQQLFKEPTNTEAAFEWLTHLLAKQTSQVVDILSDDQRSKIARHFLCSTMIELPFTTGDISWSMVSNMLAQHGTHQADTFINAYECASWGYSLRHDLHHNQSSKFLLVSIIDANIYDLEFWRYNEHWHESGFGITTVLIEVNGQVTNELITQCANTHNSMAEFATVIRRHAAELTDTTLAMPFFPENIQQMFDKLLATESRLDDLHQQWGHCFGSDPWLSILSHCRENPVREDQDYLACSLALNGYFAMANITVTPATQFILQEVQGYA
ncbi:MAG: hypothetical protein BM565_03270 [Gammaproteobacteria bacterium MedPE]|nr:MAG: hypothetical protein BM565_03270 [Gammaproteobacteria bacterium MedPE]